MNNMIHNYVIEYTGLNCIVVYIESGIYYMACLALGLTLFCLQPLLYILCEYGVQCKYKYKYFSIAQNPASHKII